MTRQLLTLVFFAVLAGCAAAPAPPAGPVPSSVSAPQVQAGDYWEYAVRDGYTGLPRGIYRYEVTRIDAQGTVVAVIHDGQRIDTFIYASGWNAREMPLSNLQRFRYDPPFPAHAYPLDPGKTWKSVVKSTDPVTGETYSTHIHGNVVGWERVKVPAGEFDALRIQRQVFAGNMNARETQEIIDETDWYVPALRRAVRTQASSQHFDNSRGGGDNGGGEYPMRIRGDWLIAELMRYAVH